MQPEGWRLFAESVLVERNDWAFDIQCVFSAVQIQVELHISSGSNENHMNPRCLFQQKGAFCFPAIAESTDAIAGFLLPKFFPECIFE